MTVFGTNIGDPMNGTGVEGEKGEEHVELIYKNDSKCLPVNSNHGVY